MHWLWAEPSLGVLFGALTQRLRFCLRAATLEVAHGDVGERLAIWLFAFSTALIATQALILLGLFDAGTLRQLNNRGSDISFKGYGRAAAAMPPSTRHVS